jgi:hypothetical protein
MENKPNLQEAADLLKKEEEAFAAVEALFKDLKSNRAVFINAAKGISKDAAYFSANTPLVAPNSLLPALLQAGEKGRALHAITASAVMDFATATLRLMSRTLRNDFIVRGGVAKLAAQGVDVSTLVEPIGLKSTQKLSTPTYFLAKGNKSGDERSRKDKQ